MAEAVVLNLHKSHDAAGADFRILVIRMGGTDEASAQWSIAPDTVPAWLTFPQMSGCLAAANTTATIAAEFNSTLVTVEDYTANVGLTVASQV